MRYDIIQDCSPFYIRFTHDGIDDVIRKCLQHVNGVVFDKGFTHHRYSANQSSDILNSVPMTDELLFDTTRVSLFVTQPGFYYRAHKDGLNHRYSINYTVKILDDKCVTSWYRDVDLQQYPIDNLSNRTSRECAGFDKTKHSPMMSMTAVQNEVVLFNTDLFHDFDNSRSTNERMILTLRDIKPGMVYFDDAKSKLFGKTGPIYG